jgi:hypothetical protein
MAWNGTVTCSHCGQQGHNRRGCAMLRERVESLRESVGSDHWLVEQEDARKARNSRVGETRKCAWCGEVGHNRRSCTVFKQFVARFIKADVLFRQEANRWFAAMGLGPGALVEFSRWRNGEAVMVLGLVEPWSPRCGDYTADIDDAWRLSPFRCASGVVKAQAFDGDGQQYVVLPRVENAEAYPLLAQRVSGKWKTAVASPSPTPFELDLTPMTVKAAKALLFPEEHKTGLDDYDKAAWNRRFDQLGITI